MPPPGGVIDATSEFRGLDQVLHVAKFIPANWGAQDRVSRSIVEFQHGQEPQTQQWIRLAENTLPAIPCDVIVRALASNESTSNGRKPLDQLCEHLSRKLGAPYEPERLWKVRRIGAVKNRGARASRMKILFNAYEFNANGLPPSARILVVDDLITTGATATSISIAIRKELPDAEVRLFTLARTDRLLVSAHLGEFTLSITEKAGAAVETGPALDDRYFYRPAYPAPAHPATRTRKTTPVSTPILPQPPTTRVESPPLPSVTVPVDKVYGEEEVPPERAIPPPEKIGAPLQRPGAKTPSRVRREEPVSGRAVKPGPRLRPIAFGIGTGVLIFVGFFVMTRLSVEEPPKLELPPPPKSVSLPAEPRPQTVTTTVAVPKKDRRPRGLITVPSIGLRAGPTIDTTILPIEVKEGEEVVILKTVIADIGPDWLQIKTKAGAVGWVFSGVVTPDTSSAGRR